MSDEVSFKVVFYNDGPRDEIRRFAIKRDIVTMAFLTSKLEIMFPSLAGQQYAVCWIDQENDEIIISSDEELFVAIKEMSGESVIRLYVSLKTSSKKNHVTFELPPKGESSSPKPQAQSNAPVHPRVVCDGCGRSMSDYRYKCLMCPDFDLCAACENAGMHPEHIMLRIPAHFAAFAQTPYFYKFKHSFDNFAKKVQRRVKKRERYASKGCGDFLFDGSEMGPSQAGAKSEAADDLASGMNSVCIDQQIVNAIMKVMDKSAHVLGPALSVLNAFGVEHPDVPVSPTNTKNGESKSKPGTSAATAAAAASTSSAASAAATKPEESTAPSAPAQEKVMVGAGVASAPVLPQSPTPAEPEGKSSSSSSSSDSEDVDREDWTVVSNVPAAESAPVTQEIPAQNEKVEEPQQSPRLYPVLDTPVSRCLKQLEAMGYNVDNPALINAVEASNGDITAVFGLLYN